MIWNSPKEDEYLSVRNFAQQRKFAIITAHDSILATRVKQTCDANKHRHLAPFQESDLVYISTKNISFPKGLARKLIPKYIGPYKVLKDFKNQSFRIELPPHLKQRGVHDVFHASLLRIHIPNDDCLFPGRLFTQLNAGNENESEWAVDKIISHSGSSQDAIFEVLWKAGDITWLPYLQIEYLNALKVYLDLQGVENINVLPNGKGKPPHQDPQVFLGSILSYILPQSYKTNLGAHLESFTPSCCPDSHTTKHCFSNSMLSSAPIAQAPVGTISSTRVDGLLTPLAGLDIPIPFVDANQLANDDTPRASNSEVAEVTTINSFFLVTDPMVCDNRATTKESLLFTGSTDGSALRVKLPFSWT